LIYYNWLAEKNHQNSSKIISDRLAPTSGNIDFGHNTLLSFYAQDVVDNLNVNNDIITELAESDPENTVPQLRTVLGAFLFHGEDVFKKIQVLSGGEKSRVALAKVLLTKANTIILDEPTNHLDFESKKIVQNALMEFNGTLIIVSHDIDFLEPIVSKVVEVRNKNIKEFVGGIDYYLRKKEEFESNEVDEYQTNKVKKFNRKDEKRLEAEIRQREHLATKKLKDSITDLESKIEELENRKFQLETDLAKEEVYSNPVLAKQNKLDYEQVKKNLEQTFDEWAIVHDELERVMEEINKQKD